jgi:hypothetical protein
VRLVDKEPDHESTQAFLQRRAPGLAWIPKVIRDNLSPGALWSAIGALVIAIGYVLSAQHNISVAKETADAAQKSVVDLQQKLGVLNEINTNLAVMKSEVDGIATEVNRQREWREKIEDQAERLPPHAKRRP